MIVRVLFFAQLREKTGRREQSLEVEAGVTAAEVWQKLCRDYPALEALSNSVSFAVNEEYVERDVTLANGDELALIPPVSGG